MYTYYAEFVLEISSLSVQFLHHLHMLVRNNMYYMCIHVHVCVCIYIVHVIKSTSNVKIVSNGPLLSCTSINSY